VGLDGSTAGGRAQVFLSAANAIQPRRIIVATKAEKIYDEVHALIDSGVERRDAFVQLAEKYGQPVDSIRGAFYGQKRKVEGGGGPGRPRRRETTPADAVEQATATLRKAIEAIDREITAAEERATEATAEAKALKASASERKAEIERKITALES
jgi:hypothetical protein